MTAAYQVRLYDTSGTQTAVLDDWNSLYYFKRLNDTSTHTFSIDGNDSRRTLFTIDAMVEVMRSDQSNGVAWGIEYGGFHRTKQDQTTDRAQEFFTSFGRSYLDLLHRREILYFAGTAGDTKSGAADNVMKAYVRENAGSSATVGNGRLRDGQTTGFSVSADAGAAPTWSGSASWKNLLDIVQSISASHLVDFEVVRTGTATFRFDTYYPRIGTDRTGAGAAVPANFAPGLGNMSQPFATESHVEELNDIIVLGGGDGTSRVWVERQDVVAQGASPWNRIERTRDLRNTIVTGDLNAAGDQVLNASRASRLITFQVLQTLGMVYGRDYFLGDTIVAQYKDAQTTKKIVGVEVTVAGGREDIRIHFDDENASRVLV